jgi:predicted phage terminase large subunit-like protein
MSKTLDEYLYEVNYHDYSKYIPTKFSLDMLNFIKLCTDGRGKEYPTPIAHLKILDNYVMPDDPYVINVCARGFGKSTLNMYVLLYIAVYGELPGFGKINYALYIADSMDNNVRTMRTNIQNELATSKFLASCFVFENGVLNDKAVTKVTENEARFVRKDGTKFIVTFAGAATGFRGATRLGTRPQLAILDDVIKNDEDANSEPIMSAIRNLISSSLVYALHPIRFKIIWSGTPFNSKDPFVEAIESGAWRVNAFPIAENFDLDMEKKDFYGGWDTYHSYEAVRAKRLLCKTAVEIGGFNREMMLKVIASENRLVADDEIQWYRRQLLMSQKQYYNFYITTDFATSEKETSDFSVISVWAINANNDFYYVDGICARQLLDISIEDLFRFVAKYKPLSVGVEISGQQYGFVTWLKREMERRQVWFNFARNQGSSKDGLLPNTNKMTRFMSVLPLFKSEKMYFPFELKTSPMLKEMSDELTKATAEGFKSKHDDFIDTISMLGFMQTIIPDAMPEEVEDNKPAKTMAETFWEEMDREEERRESLIKHRKSTLF